MNFILDVAKWRSGGTGDSRMGNGATMLLNPEGFQCCLGQFATQMGICDADLLVSVTPRDTASLESTDGDYLKLFTTSNPSTGTYFNSLLAKELMSFNDTGQLSPKERIADISKVLKEYGHTLEVTNEHLLEDV